MQRPGSFEVLCICAIAPKSSTWGTAVRVASARNCGGHRRPVAYCGWAHEAQWRTSSVDSEAHGFLHALSTIIRHKKGLGIVGGHGDALPHRFTGKTVSALSQSNGVGLGGRLGCHQLAVSEDTEGRSLPLAVECLQALETWSSDCARAFLSLTCSSGRSMARMCPSLRRSRMCRNTSTSRRL